MKMVNQNAILKQLIRCADICVFEVDLKNTGTLNLENPEPIFKKSEEEISKDLNAYSQLSQRRYWDQIIEYFVFEKDREIFKNFILLAAQGESSNFYVRLRIGENNYVWCRITVSAYVSEDGQSRIIGMIMDVNNLKQERDLLEKEVYIDNLTSIGNRRYGKYAINKVLSESGPEDSHLLLVLDLDNFKEINDQEGHVVGDRVLIEVANELLHFFRKTDIVCRWGGDEFVVLIKDTDATKYFNNKLAQLAKNKRIFNITMSIGAAIYPKHGCTVPELFVKADQAMYLAKKKKASFELAK